MVVGPIQASSHLSVATSGEAEAVAATSSCRIQDRGDGVLTCRIVPAETSFAGALTSTGQLYAGPLASAFAYRRTSRQYALAECRSALSSSLLPFPPASEPTSLSRLRSLAARAFQINVGPHRQQSSITHDRDRHGLPLKLKRLHGEFALADTVKIANEILKHLSHLALVPKHVLKV